MAKVIITMPAYRAETTLARTVADIPEGVADELILVDDASQDDTAQVARSMGIHVVVHERNLGYGRNQKTCYTTALEHGADIVVMLHPDYQYEPKAVPLLIAPIISGDADMTFGSRFAGLADPRAGGMPWYRFVGNRLTTMLENLMLGSRFTEMHSGMRAYTRACLLSMPYFRYSDDFMFDTQFLVDAVTFGRRVVEVPIPTRYTKESSSISVTRSVRYVANSLTYCARQVLARGRRGRRTRPAAGPRARPELLRPGGKAVEATCVMCGQDRATLVYPAHDPGPSSVEEFACTASSTRHGDIVQCGRCGLVAQVPQLDGVEIMERYRGVIDEAYLDEEPARREIFEWVCRQLADYVVRGRRLLEIGSSVGLFLDVARADGWDARGLEPSEWAVSTGRDRYGVDLAVGSIEDLSASDTSVDVIVMLEVLEHLVDPLGALRRVRSVMDDEGLLVLTIPSIDGLQARVRGAGCPWFVPSHLTLFGPGTLREALTRSGFRMVEGSSLPRSFHLSYVARRAGRSYGALADAAGAVSRLVDPKIPLGWLGDSLFAVARPV